MKWLHWLLSILRQHVTLPLPVAVVLVAPDASFNRLPHVFGAVAASEKFWAGVGIKLKVQVVQVASNMLSDDLWFRGHSSLDYYEKGRVPLVVYVFGDAARVYDSKSLGVAYESGVAVVAGNVLLPGGETWLDEIIDHELGHLLMENEQEHEDGTFMGAVLELRNRLVTPAQRTQLRRAAERLME